MSLYQHPLNTSTNPSAPFGSEINSPSATGYYPQSEVPYSQCGLICSGERQGMPQSGPVYSQSRPAYPQTGTFFPQSQPLYPQITPTIPHAIATCPEFEPAVPAPQRQREAEWQTASFGSIPVGNPVIGGHDLGGERLYIGSANINGDVIPGKVVPSHGCCYVSFDGKEHSSTTYNVLMNSTGRELIWRRASNGNVPPGAIQGGETSTGEPLYVGRHEHQGSMTIGKVHPSHGQLYLPFGGNEESYSEYEVLCYKH